MDKIQYTKIFLKLLGRSDSTDSVKYHTILWWKSIRNKSMGGLRLTEQGFLMLKNQLDIEFYEVRLVKDFKLTAQVAIHMDNFINCPWYLKNKKVYVTDEKQSVVLQLFSGDVKQFGLAKAVAKQRSQAK